MGKRRKSSKTFHGESKATTGLVILTSGLAAAIFAFIADKGWPILRHHGVGPRYVDASIRIDGDNLLVFMRNNSDDALDLVQATIDVLKPDLQQAPFPLGVYPPISQTYHVTPAIGNASVKAIPGGLEISLKIAQAIPSKEADQFEFQLTGPLGAADLSGAKVVVTISDTRANVYYASL
jgi:hypothetical protein